MKRKYVYVCFDNSKAKYLYRHPSFKIRRGNVVEVETTAGNSTAIVVKITKYSDDNVPYKGKLSNIVKILDNHTLKNYKVYKKQLKGKIKKQLKFLIGFKKSKGGKYSTTYTYKNYATVSIFYFKDDGSWTIEYGVKDFGCYSADGIGKLGMKNTLYQIKVVLKNYTNNLISEEEYAYESHKLGAYCWYPYP